MAEKRLHQRINCAGKCLLYHADSKYCGAITNISISGVFVKLPVFSPDVIMPGDTCSFILNNNQEDTFCRYSGRIKRVNHTGVGLEIVEHELCYSA